MTRIVRTLPLNRVEGDLKIQLELDDHVVVDARSSGTMYRGFENILTGRGPLDGLVITPRICGICTTAHLYAAAKALDMIYNVSVPDNAKRVRNIALITEQLQNDIRHTFLIFMAEFTHPFFKDHPLYEETVRRYMPLKGKTAVNTIAESKKILEITAILGGQWPHSSFMVPGGVVSVPNAHDISQCLYLLKNYRQWYEKQVLGCSLRRWADVRSTSDLWKWLEESAAHSHSDLGFFIRFFNAAGLGGLGKGHSNFISYGSLDMPEATKVRSFAPDARTFLPGGFSTGTEGSPFDQENITEDISHSWFTGYEGGRHPFDGITTPYATGSEGEKYSWAKAPRYQGLAAETGPLADMVVARHPLFKDLLKTNGADVFTRQLARIIRPAILIPVMAQWLREIAADKKKFFQDYDKLESGKGCGLIQAPRGALGHWVTIHDSKIQSYQIITPTAWNASPRDTNENRGPWEESLIGTRIRDMNNPVEAGIIIRSFDPCLVCTVHAINLKTGTLYEHTDSVYSEKPV